MTTIAADATMIAWDSQQTLGWERHTTVDEKVVLRHGRIYAISGDAHLGDQLIKWHARGMNLRAVPQGEWSMIVITRRGVTHHNGAMPRGVKINLPFAIGSGGDYAMGAMEFGANAAEAVQTAAKRDIYTGGDIKFLKFEDAFSIKKPRRKTKR